MAHDSHNIKTVSEGDRKPLGPKALGASMSLLILGVVLLVVALGIGLVTEAGIRRFLHAYVVGFALVMSLVLGSMFFVFVQYAVKAGWSVAVRRPAEIVATAVWPHMIILFLPIGLTTVMATGYLYPWAVSEDAKHAAMHHGHGDHGDHGDDHGDHGYEGDDHGADDHSHSDAGHNNAIHAAASPERQVTMVGNFDRSMTLAQADGHDHDHAADDHGYDDAGHASDDAHAQGHHGHGVAAKYIDSHGHPYPDDQHDLIDAGYKPIMPYDSLMAHKAPYLNIPFYAVRWVIYLAIWTWIAMFFFKTSVRQDETRDPALTLKMQARSYPCILLFAVSLTFAAIDLIMTMAPYWYSTIFGVHFFAGSMIASLSLLVLLLMGMQKFGGRMNESVTTEHYHDLGKLLKGFCLFWVYISYSQYMLLWYAAIPEEVAWWEMHGASTANPNPWGIILVVLLVGHFFIPFLGLMSRHVKRSRFGLAFWCVWLLVFHCIDLWWIVTPHLSEQRLLFVVELLCVVGMFSILMSAVLRRLAQYDLLPHGDPRLQESLAFENV